MRVAWVYLRLSPSSGRPLLRASTPAPPLDSVTGPIRRRRVSALFRSVPFLFVERPEPVVYRFFAADREVNDDGVRTRGVTAPASERETDGQIREERGSE